MADENARELAEREARIFARKENLDALNQELALNFYSARADFTSERSLGEEYAIDQFDSEPERCRRDLADARSAMLRPEGQEWFKIVTGDKKLDERPDISRTLDHINDRMRWYINKPIHGFRRAEKEADSDLVTFGNAVKSVESFVDKRGKRRLVISSWHLRDCSWLDDETRMRQDVMFRKYKSSARHIRALFPKAQLHEEITRALESKHGNPDQEFNFCHTMMPIGEYDWYKKPPGIKKRKWASIHYDSDHKMLLSENASENFKYVVDRWGTMGQSQYGYSPAALVSLPDGRGMQMMARLLMEASEKSLDPPLKATRGAVKSDIDQSAAGITWIDKDYDEKLGPAISELFPERRQIPIGIDMIARTTLALRDNWYLSKLRLPTQAKTAFETQALLEQFIRENIPLFGPWQDGITLMLDEIFATLMLDEMRERAFGSLADWPDELLDRDLPYTFNNPLRDAIERNRANQFQQVVPMIVGAAQIDPDAVHVVDIKQGLRDGVRGVGSPADWLVDEEKAKADAAQAAQARQFLSALGTAGQVADVAKIGSEAAANLTQLQGQPADKSFAYGPA